MSENLNDGILELQLNALTGELAATGNSEGTIEWIIGQDNYEIQIISSIQLKNCLVVISDKDNKTLESIYSDELSKNEQYIYKAKSVIAKFLANNFKIYIGLIYNYEEENIKRTAPLLINLKQSIDGNFLEEIPESSLNAIIGLISKFDQAKAFKDIEIKNGADLSDDEKTQIGTGNVDLVASYLILTTSDGKIIEKISVTPESLGIRNAPGNTLSGGGGQLGGDAEATSGFAGGYQAKTTTGAAVGRLAESKGGFAGGHNAKALSNNSIVIGAEATAAEKSNNSIAIGTSAAISYSPDKYTSQESVYGIAIGGYSKCIESNYSVVIGGAADSEDQYEDRKDDSGNAIHNSSYQTRANFCKGTVVIGHRAYGTNNNYGVVLGAFASARGADTKESEEVLNTAYCPIAIGYNSISRYHSSISIGPNAKAGTDIYGNQIAGNLAEEQASGSSLGQTSAIAIGRGATAMRHSTIAIGKHTKSYQYGCISMGHHSEAGIDSKVEKGKRSSEAKDGSKSIAIGWRAKAAATGAVQIGNGTNSTANTLQFRDITLASSSKGLLVNLQNSGTTGTLPISKGGTGATTIEGVKKNLGIYRGSHKVSNLDVTKLEEKGKDIEITFPSSFKSAPQVVANLSFSTNYDPCAHHFFVHSITKTGFKIRYNYNGTTTTKKNFSINYIAIL